MARRLIAALTLVLLATPAQAHRLKLFAAAEGDALTGQAYFAGGGAAVGIAGRALAPDGSVVAEFTTDGEGRFRLSLGGRRDVRLEVDGGDGHFAAFDASGEPVTAAPRSATADGDVTAMVEAAVARQIRPLREQLDAAEARTRLHDVLGGIGTIFGLCGVAAWASARRKRP